MVKQNLNPDPNERPPRVLLQDILETTYILCRNCGMPVHVPVVPIEVTPEKLWPCPYCGTSPFLPKGNP